LTDNHEHEFRGNESESEIEELIFEAWIERFVISVFVEPHHPHCPTSVILRRAPFGRR
jgi:hypothetical protein